MTLQEAYKICPDIKKITLSDLTEATRKCASDPSFTLDITKTLDEQGFDELDCVEIIMEIERVLNINIHDDVFDFIVGKPTFLLQQWREIQINKILND